MYVANKGHSHQDNVLLGTDVYDQLGSTCTWKGLCTAVVLSFQ